MSTNNCIVGSLTPCDLRFPPYGSGADPITNFTCPQSSTSGSFITRLTTGECTTCGGGNPYVGCLKSVECSDGTVLAGTAGDCVTDTGEIVSNCSGSGSVGGGVGGFGGRSGASMNQLTVQCANGGQAAVPPFDTGGTTFNTQVCPNTHRMTGITASSGIGQSRVFTLVAHCTPLQNVCIGNALNDPVCTTFCDTPAFVGQCDSALFNYCSSDVNFDKAICGCSLPSSQYTTLNLISASGGIALPVACAAQCAASGAITTSKKGTCNVGVVCVQSNIDITAAQSQLSGGITLSQNCGNQNSNTGSSSSFFSSPIFYIIIAVVVLAIIGVIILVIINNNNKNKRLEEDKKEERRRRLQQSQRPQVVRV